MILRTCLFVFCVSTLATTSVSAQWTAYNDCARPDPLDAEKDFTADNVTSYSIYNGHTENASGQLIDFITGDQLDVNVEFRFDPDLGIRLSSNSGENPTGGDAHDVFHSGTANPDDWIVDFSGEIIYYGSIDGDNKWWTEIEFTGLDPQKTYTFIGTAIRGEDYPLRHSLVTISGNISALNNSSDGTIKTDTTTIFNAGDNSVTNYVVRWDNITVQDDGNGTGSFVIRAEATDDSDEGKAYPLNGFMLQAHEPEQSCPLADITDDCIVNIDDLENLAAQWMAGIAGSADINGDNTTDLQDFAVISDDWLLNWQKGSLQVNIEPAQANAAGAQWRITGGQWNLGGDVLPALAVGDYTVEYKTVDGWDSPGDDGILVQYNETAVLSNQYVRHTGSVSFTIIPSQAVTAGVKWSLDGGTTWHDSGVTVSGIETGSHTVEFIDVDNWTKPDPVSITVEKDLLYVGQASYTRHTGSLQVIIEPSAAVSAGAQWSIDGGTTWHNSGQSVSGIPTGSVSIQFKDVNDWATPATQTADIELSQTTSVTGTYSQHTGSMQVTITPSSAVSAGAKWSIDNGTNWNDSGQVVSNLAVGNYTVTFSNIPEWITPADKQATVVNSQMTTDEGQYVLMTGSIQVMIEPVQATAAGAQWRINQGTWHNSGDVVTDLIIGEYSVEYSVVPDWTKPGDAVLTVTHNDTASTTGRYTRHTGSLTVNIAPAQAVSAGAKWSIDTSWNDSGDTLTDLPTGTYTVRFNDIDGWDTPGSRTVEVLNDQTVLSSGNYSRHTGSLQVTITPVEASTAGARWSVDNGNTWYNSGQIVNDLIIGDYTLTFKDIPTWLTPAAKQVTITNDMTTLDQGNYARMTGSIQVVIEPAQAAASGKWSVDNGITWYNSGQTISNVVVGDYVVEFSLIPDWQTPGNKILTVVHNDTAAATGQYTRDTGAISVTITPAEAIVAGAKWSIDNGISWNSSGSTLNNLPTGSYTVLFDDIGGWETPASKELEVLNGETTLSSGNYIRHTGSLRVTITPPQAVSSGAQWSVDSGVTWNNSGSQINDLPTGQYTIQFKAISGWTKPGNIQRDVLHNETTSITESYTQQTGSLLVTISPSSAVTEGALWSVDSGLWQASGDTVDNLGIGDHIISFADVDDWITPDDYVVTILENQTVNYNSSYILQTGSVTVNIDPSLAVTGGAQWKLDDNSWQDSGDVISSVRVGNHTIYYKSIAGWDAPASEAFVLAEGQAFGTQGSYVRHVGSVSVTITPAQALTAGAQWSINGGTTWNNSGTVVSGLETGDYTVIYKTLPGWDKPADEPITVQFNLTTSTSGNYTRQYGSLTVEIFPAQAAAAGAQWSIDGITWHNSLETIDPLEVDTYTIQFSNIDGWSKPGSKTIDILEGITASESGTYSQLTGSLQVTLTPAQAVSAGGQWSVDSGPWQNSGATVSGLAIGSHTVTYKTVDGYNSPATDTVNISDGQLTQHSADYILQAGSLTVNISPSEAVTAGARWSIDSGQNWNNSGDTINGLEIGDYTVTYNSLADWNSPSSELVTVSDGQTEIVSAVYQRKTGSLQVTLSPAQAATDGARWRIVGGGWNTSGTLLADLPTGSYDIEYKAVAGWDAPAADSALVNVNITTEHTASYVRHTGSVRITITPPAAVSTGARWSIDNGTIWNDSGDTVTGVEIGSHTVSFKSIDDWYTPADIGITVTQNDTTVESASYVRHTGLLTVTITPAQAIADGALWSVDNGSSWHNSGDTIADLETGDYTVTFNNVSGWNTPDGKNVTILNSIKSTTSGDYLRQTGSVSVTINPPEAVTAGAGWSVDGGLNWNNSESVLSGLDTGDYTVTYKTVSGWNKPADEIVNVQYNVTASKSGTYTRKVGSLRVAITPALAVSEGAQWRITDGTWRNSGYTETNLPVGNYTIEYKDITGWNTPANMTVSISENLTTEESGLYIERLGSIQVNLSPTQAVVNGAMWSVDNGITWNNSGNTISQLRIGSYTVKYNTINDWQRPADESATINEGQTTVLNRTYIRDKGSLTVSIEPDEAGIAGAQWSIDNINYYNSGYTLTDLDTGSYTVQFNTIGDWNSPPSVIVDVEKDLTASVSGTYVRQTGSVSVTIAPAQAVTDGAQWSVDNGTTWNNSGAIVSGLDTGGYTVTYKTISGWNKPADKAITVQYNQTETASGSYIRQTGSLTVTMSPASAVTDGAQWSIDGGITWHDSSAVLSGIETGDYTVTYKVLPNWDKPADEAVTVLYNVIESESGTYIRHTGSLTVNIEPASARTAGAQWSIDGSNYHNSGYTLSGIDTGSYSVQFNSIEDWNSPSVLAVDVEKDLTASGTGTYIRHTGSVSVTIAPAQAVTDGAQWSIDDGLTWNNSGEIVSGLDTGGYTVTYKTVSGWNKPADEVLTVQYNQTESISGSYVRQTGFLTVTISPASAVTEGAQWRVNGGAWQNSGATVNGLVTGDHTIDYKEIADWNEPLSQTVTINYNQTTSQDGTYQRKVGSLRVDIEPAEAVSAGARWSIDNGQSWHNDMEVINDLPTGDYLVEYKPVSGWNNPGDKVVTVLESQTLTESGTYIRQTGSITVNISPSQAVTDGAQWSVDGGTTWHSSGAVVSGLDTGNYTVEYKQVSGWDEPADETITVNYNQTTSESGIYTLQTGILTVELNPQQAVDEGAHWRIIGESTWRNSGDVVMDLPVGSYTIEFDSVAQWHTPNNMTTAVADGQVTNESGNYILMAGVLTLDIEPEQARQAGAQWTIDSGTIWHNSGDVVTNLRIGSYTVEFNIIDNYDKPDDISVNILDGQTTMQSASYAAHIGSLQVTILPEEAVSAGAQWTIDAGATWNNSGITFNNLPVGLYTIEYKDVAGWTSPNDHSIGINKDITSNVQDAYVVSSYVPLIISEFMADNDSDLPLEDGEILDEDGDNSDWIEIYNPTDTTANLNNWILADGANQWIFPDVSLDAGRFLIVFASGKNRRNPASELHTNFGLGKSGEYLALMGPDGKTIVHEYYPKYPYQLSNTSFGVSQYSEVVVDAGADIKYIVPTSSDASVDWTTQEYTDSSWEDGKIGIGFGGMADEGLVAYYSMNEGSGAIAYDSVGGHHGSLEGNVTWATGPLGGSLGTALDFAGSDGDFLDCGNWNPSEATGQLSVSHWIYWRGTGYSWQGSIGKRDTWNSADMMWQVEVATSTGVLVFKRNGDSPSFSFTMPVDQWVHVAVTFDGTTAAMYRDGTLVGSDEFSFGFDPASALTIGACQANGGNPWNGLVDEVRLYDRALEYEEVQVLATGGNVSTSLESRMKGTNSSVWLRIPFQVEDVSILDALVLSMKYEDGFVAYINGHEVARRNADGSVQWNSYNAASLSDRPDADSEEYEPIVITGSLGYVQSKPAWNVLAIHGLNDNINNDQFLILPKLTVASNQALNRYFTAPTPGDFNQEGFDDRVGDTKFDHDRGFYTTAFDLAITCDTPSSTIRYTLNGSEPSYTNGIDYTGPIHIGSTTTVRAVALRPGWLDSNIDTQSYIFVQDVINQSPNGEPPDSDWPSGTVNDQVLNYGMDPAIVTDPAYTDDVDDSLLAIPTMSLVTDLGNLFNPSTDPSIGGIYVNAALSRLDGRAWEKPASLELINPDGSKGFQINCGVRIRGGYSRSDANPKHAFRFFFREQYGDAKLEYPLFGNEGVEKFDKIDLRCSQNYSWAFSGNDNNTMVREVFSRDMQREMDKPYTRSRYYHLYVNGQYWGLFQTQERSEANYAESYFGGNDADYDVIKIDNTLEGDDRRTIKATDGNLEAYQRLYYAAMAGFESDEDYMRVQGLNPDGTRNPAYERLLDAENLIDHMIINYYTGDRDGPGSRYSNSPDLIGKPNNMYGIFNRENPDGWKWFEHDSEHSLGTGDENMVSPFTNAGLNIDHFGSQWLHEQLANQNPEYRLWFADRVHKHFFNSGVLSAGRAEQYIAERASQIDLAVIAESARWGDSKTEPPRDYNTWVGAVNEVYSWMSDRVDRMINQFRDVGWFPAIDAPSFNQHGGYVSPGFNVTMSNPNADGSIYYTLDGSDPRLPVSQSAPGGSVTLLSENASKKYLVPSGQLGTSMGSILGQYWFNISGTSVSDLTSQPGYPDSPDETRNLIKAEIAVDQYENYGVRLTGYIHPPDSGDYTFWISSDDSSQLWLSPDDNPANVGQIAYVDGWTSSRQWDKFPATQQSDPVSMQAGQRYYIEAMVKEGGGGDNLAVGWQGPGVGGTGIQVIDGAFLSSQVNWFASGFDDSAWSTGSGSIGYETRPNDPVDFADLIDINVKTPMRNINSTCYIRIPFTVLNTELSSMSLNVRYDDGFIAYLNGTEIQRVNFDSGSSPQYNSSANATHDDAQARNLVSFDITSYIELLKHGENILSIQALNISSGDSDFLLSAEITGTEKSQGDISTAAITYVSAEALNKSTHVKSRVFNGIWSALNEAVFAVGPVADSLRITEIMYHPADPNHEFIELQNVGPQPINLNLVYFKDGVDFAFSDYDLASGQFVLVVRNQAAFEQKYGTGLPVGGQYSGALDNSGEKIRLRDALGNKIQTFDYKDGWYPLTDGLGFSLTILDSSSTDPNNWDRKEGWRASTYTDGSPGDVDTGPAPGSVLINEVLAHSHDPNPENPTPDWIELKNTTDQDIDISGWFISDDFSLTEPNRITKYEFPADTTIPRNGYLVIYEDETFGNPVADGCNIPFGLSEAGETLYLHSGSGGQLTGAYMTEQDFDASHTGITMGRYEKASLSNGYDFVALYPPSPENDNSGPWISPIVITEIMYNPANSGGEYIEIRNTSGSAVTLMDSVSTETAPGVFITESKPWILQNAVDYTFPDNTTIGPGEYLIIARNRTDFLSEPAYSSVPSSKVLGPYDGKLANEGEKIELAMPGDLEYGQDRYYIPRDEVKYNNVAPWPISADGGGHSLHRIDDFAYANDYLNWTAGSPGPNN